MIIDDYNQTVWVRQSWLNDLMICPERARYGSILPDWRTGSEATAIGTGMHSAIEAVLQDQLVPEHGPMAEYAMTQVMDELDKVHRSDYTDEQVGDFVSSMCTAWIDEIAPDVEFGGECEMKFAVKSGMLLSNGYELGFTGTIDYVTPSGTVWDWKTANRAYSYTEKQKMSIQASVYAVAVANMENSVEFPVDFRYGVMLRQAKPKGQIVYVRRSREQAHWVRVQATQAVEACMKLGTDTPWFANDQTNLCSPKWCNYWSVCKGALVHEGDLTPPSQK